MEPRPPLQKIPNLLQAKAVPTGIVDAPLSPGQIARRRFWKLFVFDALSVAAAAGLGAGVVRYIDGGLSFGAFLGITGAFLLSAFFDFLLAHDPRRKLIVGVLQIIAFLGFFHAIPTRYLFSAAGILAFFFLFAERSSSMAMENSLKFSMWSTSRAYMKKVFTGLALAVIVMYVPQTDNGNVFVSRAQFQRWYGGVADFAKGFYIHTDFKGTVGTFAQDIARMELLANPQFRDMPQEIQDVTIKESAKLLIAGAGKAAGFQISSDMSLADALYGYLEGLFGKFRDQFGQSFVAVWAVALFAIIWSLGTVFIWAVVFAGFLVYELLSALNIVRIAGEQRTKEVVEIG